MNLHPRYSSVAEAWEAYLEYSPAGRAIVESRRDCPSWQEVSERFLQMRSAVEWVEDWEQLQLSGLSSLNALREWKTREMVWVGFWEFASDISIHHSTLNLSLIADFVLRKCLDVALSELGSRLQGDSSTFAILALGKLGGQELNFNSDIDLAFIYGEEKDYGTSDSSHQIYNRVASRMSEELSAKSVHGQLFRVDLRLRPEGDKGPLARSLESTESYYAAFGEVWERLAMLKARACAGNKETGYEFHQMIQPFCYARDFMHDLLTEISHLKHRTEQEIVKNENLDYNVKLGPGGIRDLEFYVQGLQLLHGAKNPYLQQPGTMKALDALRRGNIIDHQRYVTLKEAYEFWRILEHRIQIVEHRQTHALPSNPEQLRNIALSLGFSSQEELWDKQLEWRKTVRAIYDELYHPVDQRAESDPIVHDFDSHSFTDPQQAERVWISLAQGSSDFHVGRRTLRAFQRMAPHLSRSLSKALRADLALSHFASFVQVYGSRSLLFESFSNNPRALDLLIRIFDASQYLAQILHASPELFEEVARGNLDQSMSRSDFLAELRARKSSSTPPMKSARLAKREHYLRLSVRWLLGLITLEQLQEEWTAFAEACLEFCWEEMGKPALAIVGMGKLGGAEMGFGSDLDVLFVGDDNSLAQEFLRFVTEHTSEGILFPMDARLRPFAEGDLAQPVSSYDQYYKQSAQFWELQSLCKARFVAGDESLGKAFFQQVFPLWSARGAQTDAVDCIVEMRQRIVEGRCKSKNPRLEFKTGEGGMMDSEFLAQTWQMHHGFREPNTLKVIQEMHRRGVANASDMAKDYQFLRLIETWLRFDSNASTSHLPSDEIALNVLAKRCHYTSGEEFLEYLDSLRARNRKNFNEVTKGIKSLAQA